jgi:hypothetical protein
MRDPGLLAARALVHGHDLAESIRSGRGADRGCGAMTRIAPAVAGVHPHVTGEEGELIGDERPVLGPS